MPSPVPLPVKNSVIILDTCILNWMNIKPVRKELVKLFQQLEKQKVILRVSDYTTYELFSECPQKKEKELREIWEKFPRYEVAPKVTKTAAQLATLYRYTESTQGLHISDGDKIISGTALITKSYILTADLNDFPRPFFIEEYREKIIYKDKQKDKMIAFYFLKVDYEMFDYHLINRK